jgi:hypothetical protein
MSSATYLYCTVKSARSPSLARGPKGLPGASRPRAIDAGGGLYLVVSDAPLAKYGEAAIERGLRDLAWVSRCALAHEAVVEHCSKAATVVPMKLFTLFTSDERAAAHVKKERARLERVFARIKAHEEWGVRVYLDEEQAASDAVERATARAKPTSGAAFLMQKKKKTDAVRGVVASAHEEVARLYQALAEQASEARMREAAPADGGTRMLLDGVYLVPRARRTTFASRAKREAKRLAPRGFRVTLTGPWPPYHFVERTK